MWWLDILLQRRVELLGRLGSRMDSWMLGCMMDNQVVVDIDFAVVGVDPDWKLNFDRTSDELSPASPAPGLEGGQIPCFVLYSCC